MVVSVRFVPSYVRSAHEVVATERRRTSAERDAFAKFADRIADLESSAASPASEDTPAAARPFLQPDSHADTQLARSRDAYRETIMSVPHYDEEYDESLREHLTAEFSPDIATALMTGDQFLPSLQEQLVAESRHACTSRDTFLNALADEASALQTADERLTGLGSEIGDLLTARSLETWTSAKLLRGRQQVQACERECEELAADRQATLREQRVPGVRRIDLEFTGYLYQPLSVTYPVLADIASLAETLHTTRLQVDHALGMD
jgi:hypothetical protein